MSSNKGFRMMPTEVIARIFDWARLVPDWYPDLDFFPKGLMGCCLVCKKWQAIAQPLMYESITLSTVKQMELLLESLKSSRQLQGYVAGLRLILPHKDRAAEKNKPRWPVMVKCLKRMRGLERLHLQGDGLVYSDELVEEICSLPVLKSLILDGDQTMHDCRLWLELPPTLQQLQLTNPTKEFVKLLPKICQNLSGLQAEGPSDHLGVAGNPRLLIANPLLYEAQPGLRSLALTVHKVILDPLEWMTIFESLPPVLSGTLTSLSLSTAGEPKTGMISKILRRLPLLQKLDLQMNVAHPGLFEGVMMGYPFIYLRSLELTYNDPYQFKEVLPSFFQALFDFIKHSPLLTSLIIDFVDDGYVALNDAFIYQLIAVTSIFQDNHSPTRLRRLHVPWAKVPIKAFEYLCRSAPILNHLAIEFPCEDVSRIGRALGQLPSLNSLRLTNTDDEFILYDGDTTELIKYTVQTFNKFIVANRVVNFTRTPAELDPSGRMGIRVDRDWCN